jgi:hypothetical protein
VSDAASNLEFLAAQMADYEASWGLGTFRGARRVRTRPGRTGRLVAQWRLACRGDRARGIGIEVREDAIVRLETATRDSWSHRGVLCLPQRACAL